MSHNIDEIQLLSADIEALRFKSFVENWAYIKDEEIMQYPSYVHLLLANRRDVSKRYLMDQNNERDLLKHQLIYTNSLIKTSLALL